jgi:hypothetical protein
MYFLKNYFIISNINYYVMSSTEVLVIKGRKKDDVARSVML